MQIIEKGVRNALFAGVCGSLGSLFGKLSGGLPGYEEYWYLNIISFAIMVTFNTAFWAYFIKALQNSDSTLRATVLSSTTNYLGSAMIGSIFFNEVTKLLWWCGITLIVIGVVLISDESTSKIKDVKIN